MFLIVSLLCLMYGSVMFFLGLPWLIFLPWLCFLGFSAFSFQPHSSQRKKLLVQHTLLISWILIWIWAWLVLYEFWVSLLTIWISMTLLNALSLVISYRLDYKDGHMLFHIWLYIALWVGLWWSFLLWFTEFYLLSVSFFLFCLYAWVSYIWRHYFDIPKIVYSLTYFTFHLIVLSGIYILTHQNKLVMLLCWQLYLFGVYMVSYGLRRDFKQEQKKDMTLTAILSGERIVRRREKKSMTLAPLLHRAKQEVGQILPFVQFLLNSLTVFVVWFLLVSFVVQVVNLTLSFWDHIVYWISIWVYVANFFVLHRDKTMYDVHRFMFFCVINAAYFLSIFLLTDFVVVWIVFFGVLWTLAQTIMMLFQQEKTLLMQRDYYYWSIVVVCVIFFVLMFMIDIEVSGQLLFAWVMLYVGIQALLMRYVFQRLFSLKSGLWELSDT